MRHLFRGLLDLVFPLNCALCGQYDVTTEHQPLCQACCTRIPYNVPPFCARCSRPLEVISEEALCRDCREHPPLFDDAWAFTRYKPPLPELIAFFKFRDKTALRKTFRLIAATFLDRNRITLKGDFLIPIPIHPVRRRERGYNQTELLARELQELTGIPARHDILARAVLSRPQRELDRNKRWTNISGAFTMKNSFDIKNRNIIIVDDLLTTGATASEAARTLKDAGAARVILIALAAA